MFSLYYPSAVTNVVLNLSRFEQTLTNNISKSDSYEEHLKSMAKIIQLVKSDLQQAMEVYEELFNKYVY